MATQRLRELYDGAGPELADDSDLATTAEAMARRDARLSPDMTLGEWRAQLEANIAARFNKFCGHQRGNQFTAWGEAVRAMPPDARPEQLYALTTLLVLSFTGW